MRIPVRLLFTLMALLSATVTAQAQWAVTPYLGINVAGDAEFRRGGPGVSLDYFGGVVGFEFDVERYNHFYKDRDVASLVHHNCGIGPSDGKHNELNVNGNDTCVDLNTDAVGYMANVVVPIRIKWAKNWRPYATAGLGVIRSWLSDPSHTVADTEQTNLALGLGLGAVYSSKRHVGVRGDVRYTRATVDEDKRAGFYFKDYGFVRATVGVTVWLGRRR